MPWIGETPAVHLFCCRRTGDPCVSASEQPSLSGQAVRSRRPHFPGTAPLAKDPCDRGWLGPETYRLSFSVRANSRSAVSFLRYHIHWPSFLASTSPAFFRIDIW